MAKSCKKKHEIFCDALCLLGESLDIEETVYDVIEQMVCTAYGFENVANINEVGYWKCCSKQFPDPPKIPQTRDELRQHVKRVNYQAFIWKKALEVEPLIPNADGYAWDYVDNCLRFTGWIINLLLTRS